MFFLGEEVPGQKRVIKLCKKTLIERMLDFSFTEAVQVEVVLNML